MFQRGWFHVDVRCAELAPQLVEVVRRYAPARVAPLSVEVMAELADTERFAGLIVELSAPVPDLLDALLERAPSMPVLALLDAADGARINRLQVRGVASAVLPLHSDEIVSFVQRALTHNFVPSERVARVIAHIARARDLTPREVQLLGYCLGDQPRALVRRRLGITENTLKSQTRLLLRKCGARNLDSLAKNVLRMALMPAAEESAPQLEIATSSADTFHPPDPSHLRPVRCPAGAP